MHCLLALKFIWSMSTKQMLYSSIAFARLLGTKFTEHAYKANVVVAKVFITQYINHAERIHSL